MLDDETFFSETLHSPWTHSNEKESPSKAPGGGARLTPTLSAGEELNFSDMFETESSFDHRRSRSVRPTTNTRTNNGHRFLV